MHFFVFQTEIAKRLNAIIAQILPFLSQEHQQQVATAVERAKQVTMTELNAIIGVSIFFFFFLMIFDVAFAIELFIRSTGRHFRPSTH